MRPLPEPGQMVGSSERYVPAIMKGLRVYPENPFRFDFIIDTGDTDFHNGGMEEESAKLIKYFLASLTVPEEDLWVNLSPYEKDRIVPEKFGVTEMGRDLLAQDYLLKQLTASLIYPEDELGSEFWKRIYQKAYDRYGTTEIPINTFNKVWVVPDKAVVYQNGDTAFVAESRLKVMLEKDYLSLRQNLNDADLGTDRMETEAVEDVSDVSTGIIKEIILPEIEKEVNEGRHFTLLRQVYHSLILATWFKRNLKQSMLARVYVGENKVNGVDVEDKEIKEKIYSQYLDAFKLGVYDYIREDYDIATDEFIPRKYFAGGMKFGDLLASAFEVREPGPQATLEHAADTTRGRLTTVSAVLDPVRDLDQMRKILEILPQSEDIPQVARDAAGEERILEQLLDYFADQDLVNEVREETVDGKPVKIYILKTEAEQDQVGQAIRRYVFNLRGGVRAVNFKGTEGVWKIVGFENEIEGQLELEREEVRERMAGRHWMVAYNNARRKLGLKAGLIDEQGAREQFEVARRDTISASIRDDENAYGGVFAEHPELAVTPPPFRKHEKNRYVDFTTTKTEKTEAEIQMELDLTVQREHYRMYRINGFIRPGDNAEARVIHGVFDRLIEAYNIQADLLGQPHFMGKLFVVDSPAVNAFVFAEHTDVYVYAGIIRELARYAHITGQPFSADLLAALMAHELTHVLQHSSFMGLSFTDIVKDEKLNNEILEMKRKAEYHADEGGMSLLSIAGYNPESMLVFVDFLQKITRVGTTEEAVYFHPHPKERTAYLETIIESGNRAFPRWNRDIQEQDAGRFLNFKGRHLGPKVEHIHSLADVKQMLREAETIEEVLELVKIAHYMEQRLLARRVMSAVQAESGLSRHIYAGNVLDVIKAAIQNFSAGGVALMPTLTPENQEGLLVDRLLQEETQSPPDETKERMARLTFTDEGSFEDSELKFFNNHVNAILGTIEMSPNLETPEKIRLLDMVRAVAEVGRAGIRDDYFDEGWALEFYATSDPSRQGRLKDIVEDVLAGRLASLDELKSHPFSVYLTYGKDRLFREIDVDAALRPVIGKTLTDTDIGKGYVELEFFPFYEKDIRLLDVQTPEQRRRLFQSIMLPYFLRTFREESVGWDRYARDTFYSEGMQEAVQEAVLRTAPDLEDGPYSVDDFGEVKEVDNEQAKEMFAAYVSGDKHTDSILKLISPYLWAAVPVEAERIFSDIFSMEYDANGLIADSAILEAAFPQEITKQSAAWIETNKQPAETAQVMSGKIEALSGHEVSDYIFSACKNFSVVYRTEVLRFLSGLKTDSHFMIFGSDVQGKMTFAQWSRLLGKLVHPEDHFKILLRRAEMLEPNQGIEKTQSRVYDMGAAELTETRNIFDWLIAHKPASMKKFKTEFMATYLRVHIRELELQAGYDLGLGEIEAVERLRGETQAQVERRVAELLTSDWAFDFIRRLGALGLLVHIMPSKANVAQEDDFFNARISQDKYLLLESDSKMRYRIPSADMPVGFILPPYNRAEQLLFRRLFDLNFEQLGEIAATQEGRRGEDIVKRGRLSQQLKATRFQKLLDCLMLFRLLQEYGWIEEDASSEDFRAIFSAIIYKSTTGEMAIEIDQRKVMAFLEKIKDHLSLRDPGDEQDYRRAEEFFMRLRENHFFGHCYDTDTFFSAVADTDRIGGRPARKILGLELFPVYAPLMSAVQLPLVHSNRLEDTGEERDYIEAAAKTVDLTGEKAAVFKDYDMAIARIWDANKPLEERLRVLEYFFPEGSLFRDGYIDRWERALVPEMQPRLWESMGIKYLARKRREGRVRNRQFTEFEVAVMMTPLQWEKVKNQDLDLGKRADEVLDFYMATIPLVFDPQRQMRMGMAAMKIFRQARPDAGFEEELNAIRTFLPFASERRDKELHDLLDRHTVPDLDRGITKEKLEEVRHLFKSFQDMDYDEEVTNANSVESMLKAALASASRKDRMDVLFWLIDSQAPPAGQARAPKPKIIRWFENKYRLDFDRMPQDMSNMPEEYWIKMLQGFFLGENGLFNPVTQSDEEVMNELIDRLFTHFYPPKTEHKRGDLDPKIYDLVRELFPVVFREYSPARRTSIVLSLLRLREKIYTMSEGKRLAELLAALGPVGVKIGQYLSENKSIMPNDALRSDLASLKGSAPAFNKLAVLDILRQEGFDLSRIQIGRVIGAASMKQVHEGRLKLDSGEWVDVVIKVLRPKIDRTIERDIEVLKRILVFLKEHKGIDGGDIATTIEGWIRTEKDFRHEAANTRLITESLEEYYASGEGDASRRIRVPKVYVGNNPRVMIEERIRGIEVSRLLHPRRRAAVLEGKRQAHRDARARLRELGYSRREAREIMSVKPRDVVARVRDMLLFMLFGSGKFHADLHSDNIMEALEGEAVIDMGLVKQINENQMAAARQIIQAIMLHDAELLFDGIKAMHVESSLLDESRRADLAEEIESRRHGEGEHDIVGQIEEVFGKRQNIKTEMGDIATVILKQNFGRTSDDFSIFMKAFTQAIWVFPTDIFNALDTLNAISRRLKLSPEAKIRAMRQHAWPVLKEAMAIRWLNMRADLPGGRILRLGAVRQALARGKQSLKQAIVRRRGQMRGLRAARQNLDAVEDIAGEILEEEGYQGPVYSQYPNYFYTRHKDLAKEPFVLADYVMKDGLQSYDEVSFRLRPEAAAQLPLEWRGQLEKTAGMYFMIRDLISRFTEWSTLNLIPADRELALLEYFSVAEYGKKLTPPDVVARILTGRIMRERYKRGLSEEPPLDFLSPRNPLLRALGEMWGDIYIASLAQADVMKPLEREKTSRWEMIVTLPEHLDEFRGMSSEHELLYALGTHPETDLKIEYRWTQEQVLPAIYRSRWLREIFAKNKESIKPFTFFRRMVKIGPRIFCIHAKRTGYSEQGRFEIDIFNLTDSQAVHLSLTEAEFDSFWQGRPTKGSLETWTGEPIPSSSDSQRFDTAAFANLLRQRSIFPAANAPQADGLLRFPHINGENQPWVGIERAGVDDVLRPSTMTGPRADPLREGVADGIATSAANASSSQADVGGIDMNPGLIDLETRGQPVDFDIPFDPAQIQTIPIQGFSPVIFRIAPADLPLLLGQK